METEAAAQIEAAAPVETEGAAQIEAAAQVETEAGADKPTTKRCLYTNSATTAPRSTACATVFASEPVPAPCFQLAGCLSLRALRSASSPLLRYQSSKWQLAIELNTLVYLNREVS